ncbi:DUF2752 domain-containing protein [candidate division KSB1 bacterium]|nr:DUF2752 domain-containing protein [candidate division KSB1 bacterium]
MWKKTQKTDQKLDVAVLLFVILLLIFARILTLNENQQVVLPFGTHPPFPNVCHFKNIFGIDCPSCGLTRSFILWMHGDYLDAWKIHRLSIFILVILLIQIPYRLYILIFQKRITFFSERRCLLPASTVFILLFIGNWLYNLFF